MGLKGYRLWIMGQLDLIQPAAPRRGARWRVSSFRFVSKTRFCAGGMAAEQ
jgi:hypothetical protein